MTSLIGLTADLTANGTLSDNNAPEFMNLKKLMKIVSLLRCWPGPPLYSAKSDGH